MESNEEKEKTVNMCFKIDIVISKAVKFGNIHVNAVIDAAALGYKTNQRSISVTLKM